MNTFWTVSNNKGVIKKEERTRIMNLNKRGNAESIMTFDFSTLYSKIPQRKLLKVLHELAGFYFDRGLHNYINLNRFSAKWISEPYSYSVISDLYSLKKL